MSRHARHPAPPREAEPGAPSWWRGLTAPLRALPRAQRLALQPADRLSMAVGSHVALPPNPARNQAGGELTAHVLLPEGARLNTIGGPGFEFWVDGKNYDENGTLATVIARRNQPAEPGNWRMEVAQPSQRLDDEFLVALVPRTALSSAVPHIRKIPQGKEHGVEIVGHDGVRRWWFTQDRNDVTLETDEGRKLIYIQPQDATMGSPLLRRFTQWWRTLFD